VRIGLVVYAIRTGGVESFLRSLASEFGGAGHEVEFVETWVRGDRADALREQGIPVHSVLRRTWESGVAHARRVASRLANYDVLLLNDAPAAQSVLGLLPAATIVFPVLHTALKSMIRNATGASGQWDVVVTVSPGLRRILVQHFGVPEDRARAIANGVEAPDVWPRRREQLVRPGPLKVAYIGRLEEEQKAVLRLPEIVARALAEGSEIRLTVVGDGPDAEGLRAKASELCPGGEICLRGTLPHGETLALLAEHDVLLLPSRYEGHPVVLLEALAAGVVPVVSRLPGHTDHVVQPGRNGWLCEVDDVAAFAAALATAARDREVLAVLSEAAWRTAAEEFSSQRMAAQYLDLVREVQERRRAAPHERSGTVDVSLLGDLPQAPRLLVRPIRKALKLLGAWRGESPDGGLFRPPANDGSSAAPASVRVGGRSESSSTVP